MPQHAEVAFRASISQAALACWRAKPFLFGESASSRYASSESSSMQAVFSYFTHTAVVVVVLVVELVLLDEVELLLDEVVELVELVLVC